MKEFLKALWAKIKKWVDGEQAPAENTVPKVVGQVPVYTLPPVDKHPDPPAPVEVPVPKPNGGVVLGPPSNPITVSPVTDNFLKSGAGYNDPTKYNTGNVSGGSTVAYTGFILSLKYHPYVNVLNAGQVYTYQIPTKPGEEVELVMLEVSGTPDQASMLLRVNDDKGNNIIGDTPFVKYGSVSFTSNGGVYSMHFVQSADGPRGVQRN